MHRLIRIGSLLAPLILSASCQEDDAMYSGSVGGVDGTTKPVATPIPSPIIAYQIRFPLDQNYRAELYGAELTADAGSGPYGPRGIYTGIHAGLIKSAAIFSYSNSEKITRVIRPELNTLVFTESRLTFRGPADFEYAGNDNAGIGLYVNPFFLNGSAAQYVAKLGLYSGSIFVGGTPTDPKQIPTSGIYEYKIIMSGTALDSVRSYSLFSLPSAANFTINFSTGLINGTIMPYYRFYTDLQYGIFAISGNIDRNTGQINGTMTSAGQFKGQLYGPSASEFGIAFAVGGDSTNIAGVIGAAKLP